MFGRTPQGAACLKDESGAVAVIFALGLVAIMGAIGAAIDYNRLTQLQTKMQQAVDEAALAAVAGYSGGDISSEQRRIALRMVEAAMGVSRATVDVRAAPNGQLCVHADVRTKLLLMANQGQKQVGARSCVANNSTYEIALALDNTGSMAESASGQSKLQALQSAATALVQAINSNPKSPAAAISVVPFASAVNVGSNYQGSGAVWLDRFGQSSIHWQNYVRPAGASWAPASRFDLYSAMGATWGGCVEERPAPYLTSDAPASQSNPDSLFVPYLAPDDAGAANGGTSYSFTPSAQYPATPNGGQYFSFNSYLNDSGGVCTAGDAWEAADAADPVSHGSGAAKLCKYKGQSVAGVPSAISGVNGGSGRFPAGPNLGCSVAALQPLTTDMAKITGAGILSQMVPNGDTSLLPGFMWAWRTISPNGPFTGGSGNSLGPKTPKSYNFTNNTKIIVLMTDASTIGSATRPRPTSRCIPPSAST